LKGKVEVTGEDTIEITELPLRKWTRDYKSMLETMVAAEKDGEGEIEDIKEYHANDRVHFVVKLKPGKLDQIGSIEAIEKKFKLATSMTTSNMVLFNSERKLQRYEKVEDILEEFFNKRLEFYGKRKEYLMSKLEREIQILNNKKRFILAVVDGDINIRNVKKKLLIQELTRKGYTPMKNMTKVKSTKKGAKSPEEESKEEEGNEENEENDQELAAKEFNYLLSMPIWSLTYEKVEELKKQVEEAERQLIVLKGTKIEKMWEEDLDNFVEVLKEVEEQQEIERLKGPKAKGQGMKKKKGGRKKKEDESDEEFVAKKVVKKQTTMDPSKSGKKEINFFKDKGGSKTMDLEGKKSKPKEPKVKNKDSNKENEKNNKANATSSSQSSTSNSILKYLATASLFDNMPKKETKKEEGFLSLAERIKKREETGNEIFKLFYSF